MSRLSDRHQIEAWITALVRFCREATARELRPISVRVRHQRIRESDEFDQFFGLTAEFGADKDDVQFPSEAAKLQIVSADPHLNKLLSKYCDEVLAARKVPSGPLRVNVENLIAPCCRTVERAAPSSAACATAREGSTPRMLATRSDSLNGAVRALRCCLSLNASVATRSV